MSGMPDALRASLDQFRAQWQASALLRLGIGLAFSLLALEGLLRLMDASDAWQAQATQLRQQMQSEAQGGSTALWQERREQAEVALAAWRERQWQGADTGLLEAQLQDQLRDLAGKARLNVRELGVLRNPGAKADAAIRLRLQLEFNRPGLLALLAEFERMETPLLIDRLHLRLNSQPQIVELELRAVRAAAAGKDS